MSSPQSVTVVNGYAYIADDTLGLQIVDVSDPSQPKVVGSIKTGKAMDVAVSGDYAYVAADTAGLCIIDINNPK